MNPSKKKILEKSFSLFLVKSYDSVSLREIQELSGISRGAIYYHFKNKEEIYETVVNEYLQPLFFTYSSIPENEKKTLQETILSAVKYRQNHINNLKEIVPFNLTEFYFYKFMFQATEHSKNFFEKSKQIFNKEINGWKNSIQLAMRSGELRADIDVDYVAQWFASIPLGIGIFMAFDDEKNLNPNDIRNNYLKFYNFIKKSNIYL